MKSIELRLYSDPDIIGKNPKDQSLKPTQLWHSTGKVESGETGFGCAVGCIYCNQISMDAEDGQKNAPYISGMVDGGLSLNSRLYIGKDLDRTISHDELLGALRQSQLYTTATPLILENFNDPGNDWVSTADLATRLVTEMDHEGAISFITKMGVKPSDVEALVKAQEAGANLVGIVTYTNMPKEIEPSSSRVRLNTIRKLKEAGIPVIVSMRPMIKGINDSQENIDLVLTQVAPYADVVIVGGLFVFEEFTLEAFKEAGYPLDESYGEQIYSPAKVMKMRYKEMVRDRVDALGLDLLVHNHTSCAISQVMTSHYNQPTSDRFTHWMHPSGVQFEDDCAHCPPEQKQLCQADAARPVEEVIADARGVLDRLGYPNVGLVQSLDVPYTLLVDGGVLTFEEIASIKEGCRWYVDNLPNEAGMKLRINEALINDMNLVPNQVVKGMMLIGQEWHVIVEQGTMQDEDVDLIEKWIRSRSRHRARVITLESIKNGDMDLMLGSIIEQSHGIQSEEELSETIHHFYNL